MHADPRFELKNLSNRRLWELLRLAESRDPRIPPLILDHVRGELDARDQYAETRRFHAPR